MSTFLQGYISAKNKNQANKILNSLLNQKLVAGGLLLNGPSSFWWRGKIEHINYYNISIFTKEQYKRLIITDVLRVSDEKVPMVWFTEISCNEELAHWIEKNLNI